MRKAVVIAQKSRRGIPLHWNERCQHKNNTNCVWDCTVARRIFNRKIRSKANQQLRSFHPVWEDVDFSDYGKSVDPLTLRAGWEDFIPLMFKKEWID